MVLGGEVKVLGLDTGIRDRTLSDYYFVTERDSLSGRRIFEVNISWCLCSL